MMKVWKCCEGCTWAEVLKLMLRTAALEAFTAKWICGTNSTHDLRLRKPMENLDPWFQGPSQLCSSVSTFHIQLYFLPHIYNPFALLEYWEHWNNTAERLLRSELNADCIRWLGTWPCRQMWSMEETSMRRTSRNCWRRLNKVINSCVGFVFQDYYGLRDLTLSIERTMDITP